MPLNVDAFRSLVGQTCYGNRDIVVSGEGKNATARLGNYFFSQGKAANNATMQAFKAALEKDPAWRELYARCQDANAAIGDNRRETMAVVRERLTRTK